MDSGAVRREGHGSHVVGGSGGRDEETQRGLTVVSRGCHGLSDVAGDRRKTSLGKWGGVCVLSFFL